MDMIQLFANNDLGIANIQHFMLSGQSKRGWTTWMASPIDDRVIAMAPTVLSSLNLTSVCCQSATVSNYISHEVFFSFQLFHHYYQSFGGWPYYFWDYWNKGLMGRLDNNETQALWELVDPYSWLCIPIKYTKNTVIQ